MYNSICKRRNLLYFAIKTFNNNFYDFTLLSYTIMATHHWVLVYTDHTNDNKSQPHVYFMSECSRKTNQIKKHSKYTTLSSVLVSVRAT